VSSKVSDTTLRASRRRVVADGVPVSATPVLLGFLLVHMLLHVDRSIMSVVMEPVKREFALTDTRLGLFALAFSVAFAVAGVPLGRLADRTSRRRTLAGCIAVFGLATAACGLAQTWIQLLIARFAVGVGEAGARPPMLSMLSDLYPPERRAFATSIYYLGIPLGIILTFLAGGWIAGHVSWRAAFATAGAPAAAAALGVLLFLREPRRGATDGTAGAAPAMGWGRALATVLGEPAMRHVLVTTVLTSMVAAGVLTWAMSYLIRSHGLPLAQAGLTMALAYGVAAGVGTLTGGWVVDRLGRRDVRWRAWTPALAAGLALPTVAAFALAPSLPPAIAALAAWSIATNWLYAPAIALTQSLAPAQARGTAAAVFYLLSNVAGAGFGPVAVGLLSDAFQPRFGPESVRYAILAISALYAWAAIHFFLAGRRLGARSARATA